MRNFIILILALLFSISAFSQNADVNLLRHINVERNRSLDPAFEFITNSMQPLTIAIPAGFMTYALIKKDSLDKLNAMIVASSVLIGGIISTSLKYAVNKDRPFVTYPFIEQKTFATSPSFPSAHTSLAFALATSLSVVSPKWYIIAPSFLWASAVGFSRMHLGVHYPSDVLAGALIGSGSAILSIKLNQWLNHLNHRHKRRLRRP